MNWNDAVNLTKKLSRVVNKSGFIPDIVVGIGRGSALPALVFAEFLEIKKLLIIPVTHYTDKVDKRKPLDVRIMKLDLKELKGLNVLIVDDICDGGETLFETKKYIEHFKPKKVKTAVLLSRIDKKHPIEPDYYGKGVKHWTIFPWELHGS